MPTTGLQTAVPAGTDGSDEKGGNGGGSRVAVIGGGFLCDGVDIGDRGREVRGVPSDELGVGQAGGAYRWIDTCKSWALYGKVNG